MSILLLSALRMLCIEMRYINAPNNNNNNNNKMPSVHKKLFMF